MGYDIPRPRKNTSCTLLNLNERDLTACSCESALSTAFGISFVHSWASNTSLYMTASCDENVLVAATLTSGPALRKTVESESRARLEPTMLVRQSSFAPLDFANFAACIVSAVSPLWEMAIASAPFTGFAMNGYSEAMNALAFFPRCFSRRIARTVAAWNDVPHAMMWIVFAFAISGFAAFTSVARDSGRTIFCS
ncbi:Uncharacterised protein [uncultured archaeon]|nr:Uncharacterised protein [uncultured archaeon]